MRPLEGMLVLDLSRMLPGATLARLLLDLGARVIKIEDPGAGDPMRSAPPLLDGVGAGFGAFLRGIESVCLDLRAAEGQAALRALAARADVLVESFRPGTMARWGLGVDALAALNPGLVTVALSGYGEGSPRVAHDLNLVASSGLLDLLGPEPGTLPQTQIADVTTGLLACTGVLGALLQRQRTGRGLHLDQPLAAGPLPFLTWARADHQAGGPGLPATELAGQAAGYAVYTCADGGRLAVATVEPKFWAELAALVGLPSGPLDGLAVGEAGRRTREALAAILATRPRAAWLDLLEGRNLPVTAVHDLAEGLADPDYAGATWLPAFPPGDRQPVPPLGADTARVLAELGVAVP